MSIILDLLKSIIGAVIGELFDQLRMEDTVEDTRPLLEDFDVDRGPDDMAHLDIFDGVLDENDDGVRPIDPFT
ncbi:hypothetical protein LCGC14_0401710 [marine sediment metagenome]|uniref:Uncharacterized protein n=1 Tax=marine sediment metagenome TaxID=412755 RepID=A0A0F9W5S2_9ZZZZ